MYVTNYKSDNKCRKQCQKSDNNIIKLCHKSDINDRKNVIYQIITDDNGINRITSVENHVVNPIKR